MRQPAAPAPATRIATSCSPLVLTLVTGTFLALTAADLVNLFVACEVMLIASYVLLTIRDGAAPLRAGVIYLTINLLASAVFLIGVGLLYGQVGTVNRAELHGLVATDPNAQIGAGLVAAAVAVAVTVAVTVAASVVPLHAWLPRVYVPAGPAVTARFSGLLTRVGVHALFRLSSVVSPGYDALQPVFLVAAGVTMAVGVLGAVGRSDLRDILAFHMVSQVGSLIVPLGIWTTGGRRWAGRPAAVHRGEGRAVPGSWRRVRPDLGDDRTAARVAREHADDDPGDPDVGGRPRDRRPVRAHDVARRPHPVAGGHRPDGTAAAGGDAAIWLDRALGVLALTYALAAIAILALRSGTEALIDVALIATLLGFLATVALGILVGRRGS